jgi:hypothetical protein
MRSLLLVGPFLVAVVDLLTAAAVFRYSSNLWMGVTWLLYAAAAVTLGMAGLR